MFIVLILSLIIASLFGLGFVAYVARDSSKPEREQKREDIFYTRSIDLASSVLTYDDMGAYILPELLVEKAKLLLEEK